MRRLLAPTLALALAFLLTACTSSPPRDVPPASPPDNQQPTSQSDTTPDPVDDSPDGPALGVAGLVPARWPNSTADDWRTLYETRADYGGLQGAFALWTPDLTPGELPELILAVDAAATDFEFTPLPLLGFNIDGEGGTYDLTIDFDDPTHVAAFQSTAAAIARELRPAFLGIGNEVNRLFEIDPATYDKFVAHLPAIADAVREASPGTQVFTVFQFETLIGEGFLTGTSEQREPALHLLDAVRDSLDLVAFTTYPYFDYGTPADVPDGYYLDAATRFDGPIAFTEVGWPAAPLSVAPDSEFGGSEAEQAAFLRRFQLLIEDLDVAFALWAFPHDVGDDAPASFESVALATSAGEERLAGAIWRDWAASR